MKTKWRLFDYKWLLVIFILVAIAFAYIYIKTPDYIWK